MHQKCIEKCAIIIASKLYDSQESIRISPAILKVGTDFLNKILITYPSAKNKQTLF